MRKALAGRSDASSGEGNQIGTVGTPPRRKSVPGGMEGKLN